MSIENKGNRSNPFVVTGQDEQVLAYRFPRLQYSPMGMLIIYRMLKNRDVKGLITSKGNTTGTGKTMEAVKLSRECHRWTNELFDKDQEWSAEKFAFRDVFDYIEMYQDAQQGDVLITDELQTMVDKRRSMSHKNVKFSHAWQELRYKNVITWATAPGLHNLDKRITENTDIWINVTMQGRANVYFLTMHDFTEKLIFRRFATRINGQKYKQSLLTLPLDKSDEDYQYLHSLKTGNDVLDDIEHYDKSDIREAESDVLDTIIVNLLELQKEHPNKTLRELKQTEIAQEILDEMRSQQHISKLKRKELDSN